MKVDTQNIGPCRVKLIVKAEADETRADYDDVVKAFMRHGRVPGFRVGKVPRHIITREYHKEISEEVHGRLIRALFKRAVEETQLKLVALLGVGDVLFSPETGITFAATLDVQPDVPLPKYKKIAVPAEEPAVSDAQVDEHLDRLSKAFATFQEAAAGAAVQGGDLVSIDFAGRIDGRPVVEVAPEAKAIAEGADFWMQVEPERFLPEIVEALKGLTPGETREVQVAFDSQHPVEALRGKQAAYTVTVKAVRARVLPSPEELLRQMKAESMETLREQMRANLLEVAQQAERQRREQAVIEHLLRKADFELPESQVSEETTAVLDRLTRDAHYRGLKREDLEKNRGAIIENATASAKSQLRLRYLLGRIAEEEKITASDDEVAARIRSLADEHHMTPEQVRAQLEKNERLEQLRGQVRDEKTLTFLLAEAKQ